MVKYNISTKIVNVKICTELLRCQVEVLAYHAVLSDLAILLKIVTQKLRNLEERVRVHKATKCHMQAS